MPRGLTLTMAMRSDVGVLMDGKTLRTDQEKDSLNSKPPAYFSTGTTMPRIITFWANRNTVKVGTAATINAA